MVRTCSECDAPMLADVWMQFNKNAVNHCLKCKRKHGFKKAVGVFHKHRDEVLKAQNMPKRTITVLFPCELCKLKQKSLKYCMRHGHDEMKVRVEEDDPDEVGDETVHHDVYEKIHPDAHLEPDYSGESISRTASAEAARIEEEEERDRVAELGAPIRYDDEEKKVKKGKAFQINEEMAQMDAKPAGGGAGRGPMLRRSKTLAMVETKADSPMGMKRIGGKK